MQMLYDSDSFVVLHLDAAAQEQSESDFLPLQAARTGFEIVDKRSGKELYLDGHWAELFQQRILAWQKDTPTQDEVEDTLEGYAELAQTPLSLH